MFNRKKETKVPVTHDTIACARCDCRQGPERDECLMCGGPLPQATEVRAEKARQNRRDHQAAIEAFRERSRS